MTKFENTGRTLAAIACTLVLSTTMVLGAVGPAAADNSPAKIVRAIA